MKSEKLQFRELWRNTSKSLIVQDSEFVSSTEFRPRAIVEICWAWYDKEVNEWKLFQTIINYCMSAQRMYDIYGSMNINLNVLRNVYGEPSDEQTEDRTMENLADRLEDITAGQEMYLEEWSTSNCDINLLNGSMNALGKYSIMPTERNIFSVLHAWRLA